MVDNIPNYLMKGKVFEISKGIGSKNVGRRTRLCSNNG